MMMPQTSFDFTTGVLDSRIGFTRSAATATRVNASGLIETVANDVPRFDYDPVTLACRGLLLEETRINAHRYSEDLSLWTNYIASPTITNITSPAGTTAKLLEDTNASGYQAKSINNQTQAAGTKTLSFYAKKGTSAVFGVWMLGSVSSFFFQDQFSFSGNVPAPQGTGWTVVNAGGNWYRCSKTFTVPVNQTLTTYVVPASAGGTAGTGSTGFWGFQLESGDFATSYIQNLALSTATRNADVATITGTNFSDWWQATRGGVLVRARPGTVSGTRPWVQFDDGTANEIIALRGNTTNPELYIVDGGTPQAQIDAGTIAANTDYSLTGWWATNDCKARLDSGTVATDTSATIPTVTQARLGSDGTNYLNGHLASISYYDSFSEQIYTRRKNKAVFNLM